MIDLHTHSTESDGTLTPEELTKLAAESGLTAFALTDHDTIGGIAKAKPAADALGIELVPGIELSTDYHGTEIHILGFFIDVTKEAFQSRLTEFLDSRNRRNEKMALLLQQEGFDITMDALRKEFPESVITRAHFARYLVEQGMVKSREAVFSKYLGDNCRCYVPREKITPFEAVELIHTGGGAAFFAHPVLCRLNHDQLRCLIGNLKDAGLDGLEAIYSMNTPDAERSMRNLAAEFGLLISGGSDFHGENKPYLKIGVGKGNLRVPEELLECIREKVRQRLSFVAGNNL